MQDMIIKFDHIIRLSSTILISKKLLQKYSRKFVFSFNNENLKKHSWQKPSMVHNKTITVKK